jgi:hypothetical protein
MPTVDFSRLSVFKMEGKVAIVLVVGSGKRIAV